MPKAFDLADVLDIPDLPKYLKEVEVCMDTSLGGEQSELTNAVLRLTKAHGKRLRPSLVIASALIFNEEITTSVIKCAAAVELIHIGSLIHDDIIDESSTRWNIPTINTLEGLNYAILGGDFLFAKACKLAAEVNQSAGILAAETIAQLCRGQSAELAVQYNSARTEDQMERALYGKTAALMAAACVLGGICTNQTEDQLRSLSNFGNDFGMSFQLVDDVLDFISTEKLMGKPVGNDIKEGIYALPLILSLESSERDFVEKELAKKNGPHDALIKLLLENGTIDKTLAKAKEYDRIGKQALVKLFGKNSQALAQLPSHYFNWALSNLVAPEYKHKIAVADELIDDRKESLRRVL